MSMSDKDFAATSEHYYFLESLYLRISETDLRKKKNCVDCELLIFIYSR